MIIENMIFETVLSQDGRSYGRPTGGHRLCALEGCMGLRVGVRWKDGQLTWPCTKGMTETKPGVWRIGHPTEWKKHVTASRKKGR